MPEKHILLPEISRDKLVHFDPIRQMEITLAKLFCSELAARYTELQQGNWPLL